VSANKSRSYCRIWPNWASAFQLTNSYVLSHTGLWGSRNSFISCGPLLILLLALGVGRTATLGLVLTGIVGAAITRVTLWESS
jgi:hypothetical protein